MQFNFAEGTAVVAPITHAIKMGAVSANAEGEQLVAAMWTGLPEEREPTPTMVRAVMELVDSTDLK